jgi:hypothetical protein
MRYIQSGSGLESHLPSESLCLFLCGFPRLRNFCPMMAARVWDHVPPVLAAPAGWRPPEAPGHGAPAGEGRAAQERGRLERQRAALDRAVPRLTAAYQAAVSEWTDRAERRRRSADHGRMRRERRRDIAAQRSERRAELRLLAGGDAVCPRLREALQAPAFPLQQQGLRLGVPRLGGDHQVGIEHVVPSGPIRLQTAQPADGGPWAWWQCEAA